MPMSKGELLFPCEVATILTGSSSWVTSPRQLKTDVGGHVITWRRLEEIALVCFCPNEGFGPLAETLNPKRNTIFISLNGCLNCPAKGDRVSPCGGVGVSRFSATQRLFVAVLLFPLGLNFQPIYRELTVDFRGKLGNFEPPIGRGNHRGIGDTCGRKIRQLNESKHLILFQHLKALCKLFDP